MIRSAFRISRWMGGHILTSSSSILSSSYVLLAPRSRDYIKVNNYRWQSGDINGRSNNTNNSITARSYGDKSGRGQKKTLKADDRSDYLDLVKKLPLELSRSECLNSRVDIRQATFTSHSAAHHHLSSSSDH